MTNKDILEAIRKQYCYYLANFRPWDLTFDEQAEEVTTFIDEVKRGEADRDINAIKSYIVTNDVTGEELTELTILINLCKCYR